MNQKKADPVGEFFAKNPQMKFLLPLILVLVVVLVVLYMPSGEDDVPAVTDPSTLDGAPTAGTGETVDVLPQLNRGDSGDTSILNDPFGSEVGGYVALTGIVETSSGVYKAIVSSEESSFIVEEDGYLGETGWKVESIDDTSVTFTVEGDSKTLTLNDVDESGS